MVEYDYHTNGQEFTFVFVICVYVFFYVFLALAVYVCSPAAYKALRSFGILKMPCKSTMQAYTGAFMHKLGASSVCIVDQVACYVTFMEECHKSGKQEPKADEVLICDRICKKGSSTHIHFYECKRP